VLTTQHPRSLALTSPTSGGRSVGIVRLRAKATEFSFFYRKSEETIQKPLGDDSKMGLPKIRWAGIDWINLAPDRDQRMEAP
jgi:hypothetical protein